MLLNVCPVLDTTLLTAVQPSLPQPTASTAENYREMTASGAEFGEPHFKELMSSLIIFPVYSAKN